MCLIQIVIFLFAASLSMMNDWSQRSGVINGSTLAPLHALLILLLYYSYNPAGCFALPTSRFLGEGLLPISPIYGEGEGGIFLPQQNPMFSFCQYLQIQLLLCFALRMVDFFPLSFFFKRLFSFGFFGVFFFMSVYSPGEHKMPGWDYLMQHI